MYKVEYKTDTGTRSDDEFIGIYESEELANSAKREYINNEIGPKPLKEDFFDEDEFNEIWENWFSSKERLLDCVLIEPIKNIY